MIPSILEVIERNHSFLVTTHENPDGDAVGSSLGLAQFLRNAGKEVTVHFKDPVPELYRFLPLADQVLHTVPDRQYDVCFVLDVGEFRRAGAAITSCRTIGSFINIDHHITRDLFGAINYIDSAALTTTRRSACTPPFSPIPAPSVIPMPIRKRSPSLESS
jgi:phosphoesterase RecJ-like protein